MCIAEITKKELETLELLSLGLTNKEIAKVQNNSSHTTMNRIGKLLDIFEVKNRTELMANYVKQTKQIKILSPANSKEATERKVTVLFNNGITNTQAIADRVGISTGYVRIIARRLNLKSY